MSNITLPTVLAAAPKEAAEPVRRITRRWLKRVLFLFLAFWVADLSASLVIRHTPLQRKLTTRLEAAFGRPVEVDSYTFSVWRGPTLEAHSLTVDEDSRFGHEYFLRAESLTVRLRWQSLLRGRLELGTLSLKRPSLNLVRNEEGDWNLAEWLPRPAGFAGAVPRGQPAVRLRRIEVDSGRINFKQDDEKLAFAFTEVKGYVESETSGRWHLDLEATPSRAAVTVQQAGVLHLAGDLGGTSSRLRPAELALAWQGASVSDVLRIGSGYDYGLRGNVTATLDARTSGEAWMLRGRVELRQLHRWDLGARIDNPSLNLVAGGKLDFAGSRIESIDAALEAPNSSARAQGAIDWNQPQASNGSAAAAVELTTANLDLRDALSWFRAFHSGVADEVSLQGVAAVEITLRGWPLQVSEGRMAIHGAELAGAALPTPVRLSAAEGRYHAGEIRMAPATIRFGTPSGKSGGFVSAEELPVPLQKGRAGLRLAGTVSQIRDLLTTAVALGWDLSRGWDVAGPASFEFVWPGAGYPWQTQTSGSVRWGDGPVGGSLRAPFLNQPIDHIKAVITMRRGARNMALNSAEAFGAHWKGSMDREPAAGWQFSLSADHLAAADLDRWLNPHWQQSFLDRVLPFFNTRSSTSATPESLRATGHIRIDQFTLAPVVARRLDGQLKIDGRHFELANARADFYGGSTAWTLRAELGKEPAYQVALDFSRVDLGALAASTSQLANLFGGVASGKIALQARGAARPALLASLSCEGSTHVSQAQIRSVSLTQLWPNVGERERGGLFPEASASFTCRDRKVQFQKLLLTGSGGEIAGSGSADFAGDLAFRLQGSFGSGTSRGATVSAEPAAAFELRGPLSAPVIARIPAAASRPR